MATKRYGLAGLVPVEFETISLTNGTAVAVNSTSQTCHVLHFSVETNDVRYRMDGTDPTLTTGVLLQKDYDYWFHGYNGTSVLKFQRDTGTCTVSVMGYQFPGAESGVG